MLGSDWLLVSDVVAILGGDKQDVEQWIALDQVVHTEYEGTTLVWWPSVSLKLRQEINLD